MLRLTRQTDYGVVLLTQVAAAGPAASHTARSLSGDTRLPLPMVSKILKLLVREGLLVSHRGAKGGYRLARRPEDITVAELITALEGPVAMTECGTGPGGSCEHETFCRVRDNWQRINRAVRIALDQLTLADMTRPQREGLVTIHGFGERVHAPAGPAPERRP